MLKCRLREKKQVNKIRVSNLLIAKQRQKDTQSNTTVQHHIVNNTLTVAVNIKHCVVLKEKWLRVSSATSMPDKDLKKIFKKKYWREHGHIVCPNTVCCIFIFRLMSKSFKLKNF